MEAELLPWYVIGPEYGEVVPVLDYGQGPMEYGRDVVEILAASKRDALLLGVREFRRQGAKYLRDCEGKYGESPFAGVKVESAICPHGVWHFGGHGSNCEECNAATWQD